MLRSQHANRPFFPLFRKGSQSGPACRFLLPAMLILLILISNIVVALRVAQSPLHDMSTLSAAHRNLDRIYKLMAYLDRITDLEQGYLLSGDRSYLDAVPPIARSTRDILVGLRRSLAGNPVQSDTLQDLSLAMEKRFSPARPGVLETRLREGNTILPPSGRDEDIGRITALVSIIRKHEEAALDFHLRQLEASRRDALSAIVLPSLMTIVLLGIVVYLWVREERLQRAVRQQEHNHREWLNATLESLSDGVLAVDAAGKIILCNSAAQALCGASTKTALGSSAEDVCRVYRSYSEEPAESPLRKVLGNRSVDKGELAMKRGDGSLFPIAHRTSPILSSDGIIAGAVMVFSDISDVHLRETERQQMIEQERAARGLAEVAHRAKDDFLSLISHELRTPLQAILGWADVAMKQPRISSELQAALSKIRKNAAAQARVVEDLLDMSSLVSGQLKLRTEEVALDEIVRTTLVDGMQAAMAKGLHISCNAFSTPALVKGDRDRLQQMFWNLLSNAVKFTPEGGHVAISLKETNWAVELCVSDDGIGIGPAALPYVCLPYWQASSSITRSHGGLGLGLSLVNTVVQLHGGMLRVSSGGEGQGTTATVLLPRPIRPPEPAAQSQPQPQLQLPPSPLAGRRMLVVDDEADLRDLLAEVFEEQGVQVQTAGSAEEGLGAWNVQKYDIVICDIGMPNEDGYSLVRKMRESEHAEGRRHTPIIALTAFSRPEDQARAYDVGFDVHLAKPIAVDELLQVVERIQTRRFRTQAVK